MVMSCLEANAMALEGQLLLPNVGPTLAGHMALCFSLILLLMEGTFKNILIMGTFLRM